MLCVNSVYFKGSFSGLSLYAGKKTPISEHFSDQKSTCDSAIALKYPLFAELGL